MRLRKKVLLVGALFVTAIMPVKSQQNDQGIVQKEFVFRFYTGSDMFIFPGQGNETYFRQARKYIEDNRELIEKSKVTIRVYGFCGSKGTAVERRKRVRIMSNRVKGAFIHARKATESNFVTSNSTEPFRSGMPNAVVLKFILPEQLQSSQPDKEVVATKNENQFPVVEQPKTEQQPVKQPEQETPAASMTITGHPVDTSIVQKQASPWYLGASGGVSFGRSTFVSFALEKTYPAFSVGVLGGYNFTNVYSAEVSIDRTRMTLGTYDCCQNLWLGADGNRYFAPLSGVKSYKYSDLTSTSNQTRLGAHFIIDPMGFRNTDSKWSALIAPGIYGVYNHADVKASGTFVRSASTFHFETGLNLGVGYRVTPEASVRLTTGLDYLTGAIDALPREEHKISYVWNNALQLIVKPRSHEK